MAERQALVVDDSRSACFAMRKYLERYNYLVATAVNASEAFGWLKSNRPNVIFLDQIMPGVTGLEVLQTLKTDPATVAIPVVMCTSIEREDFKLEAQSSGALEVLHKPPNMGVLEQVLHSLDDVADLPIPAAKAAPPAAPAATAVPAAVVVSLPEPVQRYAALRDEINAGLHHLTDEILVQVSELKSQVSELDERVISGSDRDAFRRIAREEADALSRAVAQELDVIRRKLNAIEEMQRRERYELLHAAKLTAAAEVHSVAEHAIADAASRLSHRLTDAILKALGKA